MSPTDISQAKFANLELPLSPWSHVLFSKDEWSGSSVPEQGNQLSVTTNVERITRGLFRLTRRPAALKVELRDGADVDQNIVVGLFLLVIGDPQFPSVPDVSVLSADDVSDGPKGSRRVVTLDTSKLLVTRFPALACVEYATTQFAAMPIEFVVYKGWHVV